MREVTQDQNLASKIIMLAAELTERGSGNGNRDVATVELFEGVAANLATVPSRAAAAATQLLKVS